MAVGMSSIYVKRRVRVHLTPALISCCHSSAAGRYTCVAEGKGGLAADTATILVTEAASSPDTQVGGKVMS